LSVPGTTVTVYSSCTDRSPPDFTKEKVPAVSLLVGPKFGKHVVCRSSGFHSGGYEELYLLGYKAV
jgi:hypothetical protein